MEQTPQQRGNAGVNGGSLTVGYGVMAFAIGAGIMGVEITASRMLAPHFGTSMIVWTSLILSVLTACSAGYWIGGNLAARSASARVVGLLLAAAAATTVVGTWIVRAFSVSVLTLGVFSSVAATLFLGSLIVSLVVFAVPVFLLSVASPVVVKLWSAAAQDAGRAAGRYFAVSTVGSMLGTVLPTLLLVPALGSRGSMYAVAGMLALAGAMALRGMERVGSVGVTALLVLASLGVSARAEQGIIYERESAHQLIRVVEYPSGARELVFNEGLGVQSVSVPSSGRTGFYYDHFAAAPALLGERAVHHEALLLGLAGGTGIRQYLALQPPEHGIRFTGVEVDPAVVAVARDYFGLDELPVDVVEQDARVYLALTDHMFDAILIDAYAVQLYIPSHLVTNEFFHLVRERLRDGGFVAMNVNASSREVPLLTGIVNTLAASFPYVTVIETSPGSWNHLVLASDRPIATDAAAASLAGTHFAELAEAWTTRAHVAPPHNPAGLIFTDDAAPVEFLTENMVLSSLRQH